MFRKRLFTVVVASTMIGCGQPQNEMNKADDNNDVAATNANSSNTVFDANTATPAASTSTGNSSLLGDKPPDRAMAAALPKPYYASKEAGKYYYVSAVSEEDRKKGKAAGDVVIIRYLGTVHGRQTLETIHEDGTVIAVDTCTRPCSIIREVYPGSGNPELIPYNEDSIIGAAFADGFNGFLKRSSLSDRAPSNGQPPVGNLQR